MPERRQFIRHPINFPFSYKVLGSHSGGEESKTINISRGGLLFAARHPVKETSRITMKIPFHDRVYTVMGTVAHCNSRLHQRLYKIGVSFYSMTDAFKTKLIEQLYLIEEFRNLRSRQLGKEISLEEAARDWIKKYSSSFRKVYGYN